MRGKEHEIVSMMSGSIGIHCVFLTSLIGLRCPNYEGHEKYEP